jgi:fucose 4-O-acetylase-like acetyltransferase
MCARKRLNTIKEDRIYSLDNLRTFMIFLVVLNHAGIAYESSGIGAIFWLVDDPSINNLCGIINLIIDIFVMSIIFFVSGYLAPLSLKTKTGWAFLGSKLRRLMIPWAIAVFTLMPLYKVIFLYSRDLPQEHWTAYFHFSNGILSQNWLWFLPALFLFDILYLAVSRLNIDALKINLKMAVGVAFIIGLTYSICMDFFGWQGWTKTALLDFQNERLLIYFIAFLLGAISYKHRIFDSEPKGRILYAIVILTVWIPMSVYLIVLIRSFINPGAHIVSANIDKLLIWLSFHLSLLCLGYVIIVTFRLFLNRQARLAAELNKNSYPVYIIHVIVVGGIALGLLDTGLPSMVKYLILTVTSYVAGNLIVSAYRKALVRRGRQAPHT